MTILFVSENKFIQVEGREVCIYVIIKQTEEND